VVLLKPHLLWPLPLLLGAVWASDLPRLRRFAVSTVGVLAIGTALGFLLVPDSGTFFSHVLGFDSRVTADQPDLSGLPGLVARLPEGALLGDAMAVAGVVAVLALLVAVARSSRMRALSPQGRCIVPLAGVALWLALTPYAHPNDDVLLFPLLAIVIGERGRLLDARWLQVGIVGSLALILGFVASAALGAVLLGLAVATALALGRRLPAGAAPSLALAALALLPDIWPFHLVSVSLTPVAVALVAIAGLIELRRTLGRERGVRGLPAPLPAAHPA